MKKLSARKIMSWLYSILILTIGLLASCLVDPIDQVSNTNFSARAPFAYDFAVTNQKSIEIKAVNSPIVITGRAGIAIVRIWGERIVASDSYPDAEAHLNDLEVITSDCNNVLYVETRQPTVTFGRSYQVNYYVIVPDHWGVKIQNVNGRVAIDSLNGDMNVELTNGDIVLKEILGNIAVGVTNGSIYGKLAIPWQGFCKIESVNGQIQLNIPQNTSAGLVARVTNGTVSVSNLELQNMIRSQNSVSGVLGSGQGTIKVETVNGMISVNGF